MAGLPGVDSLSTYGGALANYAPVEDPSTDEDATYRNLYAANVAGMTQTAVRAWVRFTSEGSTDPSDPTSNVHGAVWGNNPSVKPVVTYRGTGSGVFLITWPETVTDELGQEHTVNIRAAFGQGEGPNLSTVTTQVISANEVEVRVFDGITPDDCDLRTFFVAVL